MSIIMEAATASDLNERIAERVRELRAGQGLSLARVSRSTRWPPRAASAVR
jgi:hypothetical protein